MKADNEDWVMATGGGYFFAPSIEALKELAETHRKLVKDKEGIMAEASMGLEPNDWARTWAKAILEARPIKDGGKGDSSFKTKLETDLLLAVRQFNDDQDPDLPSRPKLIDNIVEYEKDMGVTFSDKTPQELQAILAGTVPIPVPIGTSELRKK